jgi:hypothetical protein
VFITLPVNSVFPRHVILLMSEHFEDCTKGGNQFLDYSKVEFDYVNDTFYYLTGKFNLNKKFSLLLLKFENRNRQN